MDSSDDATVLIVDDESDLVELFAAFLEPYYSVRTATDGEEALDLVDETIDVVLLDRRMPEMSGDEVLTAIRERGFTCQVAMLTGVKPAENIVEMPFDDYRVKPINKAELVSLVEVLLERSTFDERSQQFFRLASKKAALELGDKTNTEAYESIVGRMDELRQEINGSLDDVSEIASMGELSV